MKLKIRVIREKRGMTQGELASRAGISKRSYVSYENGKADIPLSKLQKIANVLSVPVIELLAGRGAMPNEEKETTAPKESNLDSGAEKAEYEQLLDQLSVDEIITYIYKYEARRFNKNDTYKRFVKLHRQQAIIDYLEGELKKE